MSADRRITGRVVSLADDESDWVVIASDDAGTFLAQPRKLSASLRVGERVTFVSDGPQQEDDLSVAVDIQLHR